MIDSPRARYLYASGCAAGFLLAVMAGNAYSQPVQLGLHLDERFSDNVTRSANHPRSDLEHRLSVSVAHQTDPGPCSSALNGVFGFRHYQRHTYSDQADLNGDWNGSCALTDHGLQWTASDNVSQVGVNTSLALTPSNQTRRNVFSTGPRDVWLIGRRDQIQTSAQYQRTTYVGQGQSNASHYLGSANYRHQVSPTLSAGLGADYDKGKLDSGEDITRRTGNVLLTKTFENATFSATVGYSQLEDHFGGFDRTDNGLTWNARIDKTINDRRRVYAEYGRELSDSSAPYVIQIAGLSFNLSQSSALEITHWRAGISQDLDTGGQLGFDVAQQTSKYLQSGEVDKNSTATVSLAQPLVTNLTLHSNLSYEHQTNSFITLSQNTYGGSLMLAYQRTRELSFRAGVGRSLNSANEVGTSYRENWMLIGVDYQFR